MPNLDRVVELLIVTISTTTKMYLTLHGFFRFAVFSMTDTNLIPQDFYKLPVAKIQNQCFCKLVYVHINKLTGSF